MKNLNQTANKILDVAENYTKSHGFNAFSYKDIEKEVGVKTSSIHYYFSTKHDLAEAMTKRYVDNFKQLLATISQTQPSGEKKLIAITDVYKSIVNEGKFCLCGMLASDLMALPQSLNSLLKEFFDLSQKWISDVIFEGMKQGKFNKNLNSQKAGAVFFSSMQGAMLISRVHDNKDYFNTIIDQSIYQLISEN